MSYDPTIGRWLEADPIGYTEPEGPQESSVVTAAVQQVKDQTADLFGADHANDCWLWQYADSMNRYQFERGNPISLTDPNGLVAPRAFPNVTPPSKDKVKNAVDKALSNLHVVGIKSKADSWNFARITARDFNTIAGTPGVTVCPDTSFHAQSWSTPLTPNWVLKYYLNDDGTFNVAVVSPTQSFGHYLDATLYYGIFGGLPVNSDNGEGYTKSK